MTDAQLEKYIDSTSSDTSTFLLNNPDLAFICFYVIPILIIIILLLSISRRIRVLEKTFIKQQTKESKDVQLPTNDNEGKQTVL